MPTTVHVRQNDTLPYLDFGLVKDLNKTAHDLTGATVTFTMRNRKTDVVKIDGASVTLIDAAAGEVRYSWSSGDLDEAGYFNGEFQVTFADERILTFPAGEYIEIEVLAELDS